MSSHDFKAGTLLGELRAESSRHTEILLGIHDRMIDLPEDLAFSSGQLSCGKANLPHISRTAIGNSIVRANR